MDRPDIILITAAFLLLVAGTVVMISMESDNREDDADVSDSPQPSSDALQETSSDQQDAFDDSPRFSPAIIIIGILALIGIGTTAFLYRKEK